MKLFTPLEKEAQRKVLKAIRADKYTFLRYRLWPNVKMEYGFNGDYEKPPEDVHERCFMGACYSELDIYSINDLTEELGYPGTPRERGFPRISNYNDKIASSLNDVGDWLVREHGWQDIK